MPKKKIVQKNNDERPVYFDPWEWCLIAFLVSSAIVAPWLFTQIDSGISFLDTGPIGDTIGGITAPFINLLAAFLVYKSFTAQILANKQQKDEFEKQYNAIKKEQSYNTFNSLFNLSLDSYNRNGRIGNYSVIRHIQNVVLEFENKTRFYYFNGKKLENPPSDLEIKTQINMELKNPIETMLRVIRNIQALQIALKQSDIDIELQRFYHSEIEDILWDMDLWILLNSAMTDKIERHQVLNTSQKAYYEQSKALAKVLSDGYQVRYPPI